MNNALAELLHDCGGVIARRRYPEMAALMDAARKRGELVGMLPGVYAHRDLASDWRALVQAVAIWDESAVIVGEAGGALTFWPELEPRAVEVAGRRVAFRRRGLVVSRRSVPPELVVRIGGINVAAPALTALDLVARHGGDPIDRALRTRMATLAGMHEALALTPGRPGNGDRRQMLLDSRAEPWSEAERQSHRLMREAGITRWHANVPIVCEGNKFYQDIAMDDCPVVVEIDGKVHLRADMFESDRRRGNYLLLAGKQVLHFTWRMVDGDPDWVVDMTARAIERYS